MDSIVPAPRLAAIGLETLAHREYELAAGSRGRMPVTVARTGVMGELTAGLIVLREAPIANLLSV